MEKVSADTVTQLTITHAHAASVPGQPPTVEQMIAGIRDNLNRKIGHLAKSMQNAPEDMESAFKISHDKAVEKLQRLDRIVNNLPNGYCLAPVFYSKVTKEENDRVLSQYSQVRPQFLRYLAQNHATELAGLDIGPSGIACMKAGDKPVNNAGKICDLNIDHIIERGGGGKASLNKEIDPKMPPGSGATYIVNHFSNFIFLPIDIHNMKNDLNALQDTDQISSGSGKWVLMMVPKAVPGYSGYVSQPKGSWQDNKPVKTPSQHEDSLQTAASAISRANSVLHHPAPETGAISSALENLADSLKIAFNDAAQPRQDIKYFRKFYKSKRMETLRVKIENLPKDQTVKARETFVWIDSTLRDNFKIRALKTSNNNKMAPPQHGQANDAHPSATAQTHKKQLTKAQRRKQRLQKQRRYPN